MKKKLLILLGLCLISSLGFSSEIDCYRMSKTRDGCPLTLMYADDLYEVSVYLSGERFHFYFLSLNKAMILFNLIEESELRYETKLLMNWRYWAFETFATNDNTIVYQIILRKDLDVLM